MLGVECLSVYLGITNHFVCCLGTSDLPFLFRSHHYRLCKAVSSQHDVITPLADHLHGSGLIADETRLSVQNTLGLSPYDRATRLLNAAEKVAENSMQKAKKFCECLEECGIPVPESILKGKVDVSLVLFLQSRYSSCAYMCIVIVRHTLLTDL